MEAGKIHGRKGRVVTIQSLEMAFGQTLPMPEKFALIAESAQWSPGGAPTMTPPSRGYKRPLNGHMYVVGWRDIEAVKVGITRNGPSRWESFIESGAELLALHECEDPGPPEKALLQRLRAQYDAAFTSPDKARRWLGGRGAGFSECFHIPPDHWAAIVEQAEEEVT